MKNPEEIIFALDSIKSKINATTDRNTIANLIQEAIDIGKTHSAVAYEGFSDGQYIADKGKNLIISILESEKSTTLDKALYDIESVHFQVSASILMLMNKYVHGLGKIDKILNQ